jgi:hypothetical protein
MKPHPRIRKTMKWGGAAATLIMLTVWVGSRWFSLGFALRGSNWIVADGGVLVCDRGPFASNPRAPQWRWGRSRDPMTWGWSWWYEVIIPPATPGSPSIVRLPMWPVVAAALMIPVAVWVSHVRRRRTNPLGLCPNCRYDRTGLAAGALCPECGAAASV